MTTINETQKITTVQDFWDAIETNIANLEKERVTAKKKVSGELAAKKGFRNPYNFFGSHFKLFIDDKKTGGYFIHSFNGNLNEIELKLIKEVESKRFYTLFVRFEEDGYIFLEDAKNNVKGCFKDLSEWFQWIDFLKEKENLFGVALFITTKDFGNDFFDFAWEGCGYNGNGKSRRFFGGPIGLYNVYDIAKTPERVKELVLERKIKFGSTLFSTVQSTFRKNADWGEKNAKEMEKKFKQTEWKDFHRKVEPVKFNLLTGLEKLEKIENLCQIDVNRAYTNILAGKIPHERKEKVYSWKDLNFFTFVEVHIKKKVKKKDISLFNPFKSQTLEKPITTKQSFYLNNYALPLFFETFGLKINDVEIIEKESYSFAKPFGFLKDFANQPDKIFKLVPNIFNGLSGVKQEKTGMSFVKQKNENGVLTFLPQKTLSERTFWKPQIYNWVLTQQNLQMLAEIKKIGLENIYSINTDSIMFQRNEATNNYVVPSTFKIEKENALFIGGKLFDNIDAVKEEFRRLDALKRQFEEQEAERKENVETTPKTIKKRRVSKVEKSQFLNEKAKQNGQLSFVETDNVSQFGESKENKTKKPIFNDILLDFNDLL